MQSLQCKLKFKYKLLFELLLLQLTLNCYAIQSLQCKLKFTKKNYSNLITFSITSIEVNIELLNTAMPVLLM